MPPYTLEEKIACLTREIQQRKRVYPKLVMKETMTQAEADYQLGCMQAILQDYQRQRQPEFSWKEE